MRLVKRVLPNGKVEFSRTFYAIFILLVLGMSIALGAEIVIVIARAAT